MGKKVLLSLAFVVVALTAFAQTESEHLKFKGVPIDGTLREYVSKILEKMTVLHCLRVNLPV